MERSPPPTLFRQNPLSSLRNSSCSHRYCCLEHPAPLPSHPSLTSHYPLPSHPPLPSQSPLPYTLLKWCWHHTELHSPLVFSTLPLTPFLSTLKWRRSLWTSPYTKNLVAALQALLGSSKHSRTYHMNYPVDSVAAFQTLILIIYT